MTEIIGLVFGILGFSYGLIKDREVRKIHQRKNAPYFVFETYELDSFSKGTNRYDPSWLAYRDKKIPTDLNGNLMSIQEVCPSLPDDYPDNFVLGIRLINTGVVVRSISAKSRESIGFKQCRDNAFSLRYFFKRSEIGKTLFFTITYETIDGVQEKQEWLHIKGKKTVIRVKPKSIPAQNRILLVW